MSNLLFALGASDPEMQTVEQLLTECGVPFAYAVDSSGNRVHPGNAYRAVDLHWPDGSGNGPAWGAVTHLVECGAIAGAAVRDDVTVIDHHRPGDPGYGKGPEDFLAASSIGQTVAILADVCRRANEHRAMTGEQLPADGWWDIYGWGACPRVIPDGSDFSYEGGRWIVRGFAGNHIALRDKIVLAAAADHCLAAAYRGGCPGVDPDDLMRWRVESRAAFQGRDVAEVLADIESARQALRDAVKHGSPPYADLRGRSIPELPEAACREGIPFLSSVTDRGGRQKVVLQAAPAGLVEVFLAGHVVPGLVDLYGDPARGFAGGYLS